LTSHHDFLVAFEQYMKSGNSENLIPFLPNSSEQASSFLAIYRNGFLKASISSLESNFPCIKQLLSADHFFYLARTYVDHYPPASASLVGYGMKKRSDGTTSNISFLDYLQTEESIKEAAWLLDIGLLDQVWLQTLNAKKEVALTTIDVQKKIGNGEDLSSLPMSLIDSSQVVCLSFDVFEMWQALRFNTSEQNATPNVQMIPARQCYLLFWQQKDQVQVKELSLAEMNFVQTLNATLNLEQAEKAAVSIDFQNKDFQNKDFQNKDFQNIDSSDERKFELSFIFAELLNGALLKTIP